jgi:hypothetical protein
VAFAFLGPSADKHGKIFREKSSKKDELIWLKWLIAFGPIPIPTCARIPWNIQKLEWLNYLGQPFTGQRLALLIKKIT